MGCWVKSNWIELLLVVGGISQAGTRGDNLEEGMPCWQHEEVALPQAQQFRPLD